MLNFKNRHVLSEEAREFQCCLLKLIGNIMSTLYMGKQEERFAFSSFFHFSPRTVASSMPHRELAF